MGLFIHVVLIFKVMFGWMDKNKIEGKRKDK